MYSQPGCDRCSYNINKSTLLKATREKIQTITKVCNYTTPVFTKCIIHRDLHVYEHLQVVLSVHTVFEAVANGACGVHTHGVAVLGQFHHDPTRREVRSSHKRIVGVDLPPRACQKQPLECGVSHMDDDGLCKMYLCPVSMFQNFSLFDVRSSMGKNLDVPFCKGHHFNT